MSEPMREQIERLERDAELLKENGTDLRALLAAYEERGREIERLKANSYPHMCRDGHFQIGHSDSEHEMCPLCRAEARLAKVVEALRVIDDALDSLPSGVDEAADPDDPSPEDATAHWAGLMRHDIRAALAAAQPEEEK